MLVALIIGCATAPPALLVPLQLLAAAAAALAVIVAVSLHPPFAAYLLISFTPLLAGLERSFLIPLFDRTRHSQSWWAPAWDQRAGSATFRPLKRPRLRALDSAILSMASPDRITAPLAVRPRPGADRGRRLVRPDLLEVLRHFLDRPPRRFRGKAGAPLPDPVDGHRLHRGPGRWASGAPTLRCVRVVNQLYPPEDPSGATVGRGSSTLDSSIVVGDIMAYNLAIALAFLLRVQRNILTMILLAGVFFFGGLASGQFSGAIAIAVSVTIVGALTGRLRQLALVMLPASLLAAVVLSTGISERLSGFQSTDGTSAELGGAAV